MHAIPHLWLTPLAVFVSCVALYSPHAPGQTGAEHPAAGGRQALHPEPLQPPVIAPGEQLLNEALDENAQRAGRMAAANKLVRLVRHDPAAAETLAVALSNPDLSPASALLLTAALADQPLAHGTLVQSLVDLARRLPEAQSPDAVAALGSIRTRSAAHALLEFAAPDQPAALRTRAFAALWRLTAMPSLGADHDAWHAWLDAADALSPLEWNTLLLSNLARRQDDLVRRHAADLARLVAVARQLNLATPPAERSALLAEYLLDPRPQLRDLGFDLVERELRQSAQLNGEVAHAAIRLLSHADPSARRRSARLIDQIAPADAGPAVAAALAAEARPDVAVELLLACARWSSHALREPVIRWLSVDGPTFNPAARAALALYQTGFLVEAETIAKVVGVLRARPIESLSESALVLLAALAEDADRAKIAGLLESESEQASRAAAVALAHRPDFLDRILHAARDRPFLIAVAADAVVQLRPTASGYTSILRLVRDSDSIPDADALLLRVSRALSVGDLLEVALKQPDPAFQERLLVRLAEPAFAPPGNERLPFANALATLADLQTRHGRPDAALLTIERIPDPELLAEGRLLGLRATALIAALQLDAARQLNAPADAWLDALVNVLRNAPDPNHAAAILRELNTTYLDSLGEAQRQRLEALTAEVALLNEVQADPPEEQDPPSDDTTSNDPPGR